MMYDPVNLPVSPKGDPPLEPDEVLARVGCMLVIGLGVAVVYGLGYAAHWGWL